MRIEAAPCLAHAGQSWSGPFSRWKTGCRLTEARRRSLPSIRLSADGLPPSRRVVLDPSIPRRRASDDTPKHEHSLDHKVDSDYGTTLPTSVSKSVSKSVSNRLNQTWTLFFLSMTFSENSFPFVWIILFFWIILFGQISMRLGLERLGLDGSFKKICRNSKCLRAKIQ
jgi:hypothetical protein